MRISRANPLVSVAFGAAASLFAFPAAAQTAADAAQAMASALDGAGGGISGQDLISALQDAAAAGDAMAQYQLGLMYESGEGVAQDKAKAFGYFAEIADQHADAAPRGIESDIVAHSFVKMGEYYMAGVPEAGIPKDEDYSIRLLLHAATYFGDADAQYRVGELYQGDSELGDNPLQSARWLSLAARKGHVAAQAKLGNLLFNGDGGVAANPVEGLMWLTIASRDATGTPDAGWIDDMLNSAMSVATPDQRQKATQMADAVGPQFAAPGANAASVDELAVPGLSLAPPTVTPAPADAAPGPVPPGPIPPAPIPASTTR
jgi:TPR repeat protein